MPRSSRFSVALHVLTHLAEAPAPLTSERLAECVGTNPVVVRRSLAGLRDAGLVASARGTGGGWTLARDAARITLRDVYAALGERLLQGIDVTGPRPPEGGCRIQRAVAGTLDEFLDDAEALLAARLQRITLASLVARGRRGTPRHRHAATRRPHAERHA
ncbi:MAG TPA: Rrf2 family transcriptional regulator [Gemmatimonadaceae bacterium]|nr:Rrf2 family transcriptional regulator [Gemmatimonadaceae bacterium]